MVNTALREPAPRAPRPRRLGARTRKSVLVVHIVSVSAWIGMVVMAVVIFTAVVTNDDDVRSLSYQALELFLVWPMVTAGLICLASGVVLAMGSKYGVLRYWWVVIKLALNLVLTTLALVALRPAVAEAAEQGRRLQAGDIESIAVGDLVFPPIVSATALLIAVMLSVFKPWGRTWRRPA